MSIKYIALFFAVVIIAAITFIFSQKSTLLAKEQQNNSPSDFYKVTINMLSGKKLDLKSFQNKVVLVVNVASKCGLTKQYKGLEKLYQEFKQDGLIILGVPSNDFGGQEPGSPKDIQSFCQLNYGVSFPITEKVKINGEKQHELYDFLTQNNPKYKGKIKWNFTKFLINKQGYVVDRFSPITKPSSKRIFTRINKLLK